MKKQQLFARRVRSYNNYKLQESIQFPRFYSRNKNNFLQYENKKFNTYHCNKKIEEKYNNKINKLEMKQIVNKIKNKKLFINSNQSLSHKKVAVCITTICQNFSKRNIYRPKIFKQQQHQFKKKQSLISSQKKTQHCQNIQQSSIPEVNFLSEGDKKTWYKISKNFARAITSKDLFDWPTEYITMNKYPVQKKFCKILQSIQQSGACSKIRKHICLSRIAVYMHFQMIAQKINTQNIIIIFEKIKQSFSVILTLINSKKFMINDEKLLLINHNNQFVINRIQSLQLVKQHRLKKKPFPHKSLLTNMLQSCQKIDSIDFIQVLDKTLKWQILRIPSYPFLPPTTKQLSLVVDLDETLMHYDTNSDLFHIRPFAEDFILKVSLNFEVIIFTAAQQAYADDILNQIDPHHCISHKLYRNHLTFIQGTPAKDLSKLGRSLQKIIIIDNIARNFRLQPQNGILIKSWYDNDDDEVLHRVYELVERKIYRDDVRKGIHEYRDEIMQQITMPNIIYELEKEL